MHKKNECTLWQMYNMFIWKYCGFNNKVFKAKAQGPAVFSWRHKYHPGHCDQCYSNFFIFSTSQSTPQAIFRRPSRRPKQSSDVPVDTLNNFSTSQLTLREILLLAGTEGRKIQSVSLKLFIQVFTMLFYGGSLAPHYILEDCPLDTLERSSVDPVSAADRSSNVSVNTPKRSPTSQSMPQAIFRRLSLCPEETYGVLVGAGKNQTAADILNIY